jgi:putative pantetheine hydrolase
MAWLEARGRGFRVGPEAAHVVPITPAAALFDLGRGGGFGLRPTPEFGRLAAEAAAADSPVTQGSVGAGTGAVAGGLKGGVGSASAVLASGATVGALVVVNCAGSPVDVRDGTLVAGRLAVGNEFGALRPPAADEVAAWAEASARLRAARAPFNTVLAVVATDVRLTPAECSRLAGIAHDGLARAVNPVHTYVDGDVAFALATGGWEVEEPRVPALNSLLAAAADTVSRAVAHAVLSTAGAVGLPSYRQAFPSAVGS